MPLASGGELESVLDPDIVVEPVIAWAMAEAAKIAKMPVMNARRFIVRLPNLAVGSPRAQRPSYVCETKSGSRA